MDYEAVFGEQFLVFQRIIVPSETGTAYPVTLHYVPEDLNLQQHCCEKPISHKYWFPPPDSLSSFIFDN